MTAVNMESDPALAAFVRTSSYAIYSMLSGIHSMLFACLILSVIGLMLYPLYGILPFSNRVNIVVLKIVASTVGALFVLVLLTGTLSGALRRRALGRPGHYIYNTETKSYHRVRKPEVKYPMRRNWPDCVYYDARLTKDVVGAPLTLESVDGTTTVKGYVIESKFDYVGGIRMRNEYLRYPFDFVPESVFAEYPKNTYDLGNYELSRDQYDLFHKLVTDDEHAARHEARRQRLARREAKLQSASRRTASKRVVASA